MFSDFPKPPSTRLSVLPTLFLLVAAALPASGCDYFCREEGSAGTLRFEFAHDGPGFAGEPLAFSAHVSRLVTCSTTDRAELRLEVLDPDGRSVPVEEAPARTRETNHEVFRNDARFSPPVPGEYTLIARVIEDEVVQLEHLERRTVFAHAGGPPTPLETFESRECQAVHATEWTWICDGEVFRDGAAQETVEGFLATNSTTLWAVRNNQVERLVDTGAGPLISTAILTREHESAVAAFALENELTLLTSKALHHYRFANGALFEFDRYAFTSSFTPRALLRTGEVLAVAGDTMNTASVCVFTLGDTLLPGSCVDYGRTFLAATERGFWLGIATSIAVQREPYWIGATGYRELEFLTLGADGALGSRKVTLPEDFTGSGRRGAFWIESPLHHVMLLPQELNGRIVFETFTPAVARLGGSGGPFLLGYEQNLQRTSVFAQP